MKKTLILFLLLVCVSILPAYAADEITVLIPDYDFIIDNSSVYYQDSLHPVLSYKDVTYFPMTYDYCRALNIATSWVEGEGLFIAAHPTQSSSLPTYETTSNKKYNKAALLSYDVYINGEKEVQDNAEYPLFNFRGVTYFPLTYEYATEEFYWNIDFVEGEKRSLTVSSYLRGFGSTMSLYEKTDEYAVFSNPNDDNFLRLDFSDDEVSILEGYDKPEPLPQIPVEAEHNLEVTDNRFVLDGVPLAEIKALTNGEAAADDISPSYYEFTQNGVYFIRLGVYYNLDIPAPYTPFENYTYLCSNGNFIPLAEKSALQNVVKADDGSIYVSFVRYSGFRGTTLMHNHLIRVMPDGTVVYMNDLFSDYNSIELLGYAGGRVYLKCEWMPENSILSFTGNGYSISPYNDGYYTYDGESLSLLRRYTYSDSVIVSPDGKLYATLEQFGKIERIY